MQIASHIAQPLIGGGSNSLILLFKADGPFRFGSCGIGPQVHCPGAKDHKVGCGMDVGPELVKLAPTRGGKGQPNNAFPDKKPVTEQHSSQVSAKGDGV